ncbi:MAG: sugar ABC transporter ATP-binding protein [Planctomycetota bacterium]|jgi:ribose transport system ATP-binding protein|nr:sugar ABC transporter ATP-binding protein [Planctomycetota bacterium]
MTAATEKQPLFTARGISKYYGEFGALRNVDMRIDGGQIIGLIGENGAGKSTLLKIITGVEQPTAGSMTMRGGPYTVANPLHANRLGVGMVFQEQSLVRNLTVAQNIYLGREGMFRKCGVINWRAMNASAGEALSAIGVTAIRPDKPVWDLNFAARQMVEIAKVFDIVTSHHAARSSLILLDEPTSVLNETESEHLFSQVRRLKNEGHSVIFVSHRLSEVLSITDRIYVFKDGAGAGEVETAKATEQILYEMMVGRTTTGEYYKTERQTAASPEPLLSVRNLSQTGVFKGVSFDLHRGEVLGLCGVEGSGNEAVVNAICGDSVPTSGEIIVGGESHGGFANPMRALGAGILAVPKERREESIVGVLSIADNIILSNINLVCSHGVISGGKYRRLAREWIDRLAIKCTGMDERVMRLSGGNAQKVVFARAMASGARILILNHPTRGVDVGAKEEIYALVRDITQAGAAVILLGDTLDEYIGLSSRIVVMKDGVATAEFDCPAGDKPRQVDIIKHMM